MSAQNLVAPNLSAPSNGATNVSTNPTFSWSAVSGATAGYWLAVATSSSTLPTAPTDSAGAGCVIMDPVSGTSRTPTTVLSAGTTYYWRVRGRGPGSIYGNWSSTFSFTTQSASPTISSISPNSGSTAGGNSVTINGANLAFASSVTFGGTAAAIAYDSGTGKLTPTAPAHAAGAVNVTVTTSGGSVTSPNAYTYVAPVPTVTLASLSMPSTVAQGQQATVSFGLSGPAPSGGATVNISTDNTAFPVPSTFTIQAGQASGSLPVTSSTTIISTTTTLVTASYGGVTKTATITVTVAPPPTVASLTISPNAVIGGSGTVTGTVTLSGAAPVALFVALQSSDPTAAQVPNNVQVPAGLTSATFAIATQSVSASHTATITATLASSSKTATLTVTGGTPTQPNLTPDQPAGWSDKIVVSRVTGTTTDSTGLTTADTLYVDWAVINNGNAATTAAFTTVLYVDEVAKTSWSDPAGLSATVSLRKFDFNLGSLSAGPHTLRIKIDSTGAVAESDETDNEYTKNITVTGGTSPQPNLTPDQPAGWSDKIVVSRVTGTTTDSTGLTTADTLYVDWAVINNGNAATTAAFTTVLYVDEVAKTSWSDPAGLSATVSLRKFDFNLGSLSAGPHTLRIKIDSTGAVAESDETDNEYTKNITVTSSTTTLVSLNGFVQDKQNGQAIPSATVTLGTQSKPADGNGYYVFSNLPAGEYALTASKSGYTTSSPVTINLTSTSTSKNILLAPNFTTTPTVTISGTVRDGTSKAPLGSVRVTLNTGDSQFTDTAGHFSFPPVAPGTYTVSVLTPPAGFLAANVSHSFTDDTTLAPIDLTKVSATYGAQPTSPIGGDPVNTATGNYIYNRADLQLPGPGLSFKFERTYNSLPIVVMADGPLGFGWNHSYNVRLLSPDGPGTVTIHWGDSKSDLYVSDGAGGFTRQYGVFDTLIKNADGSYSVWKKDQTVYNFDLSNHLVSIVDKNGNTVSLGYSGSDLTSITDAGGRSFALTYDASGHITKIADPINRTVKFAYDDSGNLTTATDLNGNNTIYSYDANHQLLTVVDPRGNTVVTNSYDASKRVVTSQRDAKGGQTSYAYDEANSKTTTTQPLGRVTVDHYDTNKRLVQQDDANGNSTRYAYDSAGNRTLVTAKNGLTVSYAYDASGNVTGKSDPFGTTTTITYDAKNNPLSRTNALGNVTSFEYDAHGNLTKTTNPPSVGGVTTITYNLRGQPLTITDANNHTTTSAYDAAGNLTSVADALNNTTVYTYDGAGRRLTIKDALNHVTTYVYDKNNNVLSVTDPFENQAISAYDGNNNRLTAKDRRGNTTTYTYDVKDLLTTATDALGNVVTNAYDALDQRIKVTDARNGITQFAYDVVGNLISVTDPMGNVTNYTYDPNGNRVSATNPLGKTTLFTYDSLDRVIETADPLDNVTTSDYDSLNRRTKVTDANNHSTSFVYDALGHLTTVTDAAGGTVIYTYDAVGNRIGMTDPNGHHTTYDYDPLNRRTQTTDPSGGITVTTYDAVGNRASRKDAIGRTTTYTYDRNNRLTGIAYPSGTPVGFSYDANGNRIGMTDSLGSSTYQYDVLNRLKTSTDAFGQTVGYGYDANGNRVSLSYPGSKTVTYVYNAANRLITVTDWLNGVTSYTYDAAGQLSKTVNPNATVATYTHDIAGRLTGLANTRGDGTTINSYNLTLDGVGNHVSSDQSEPLAPAFTAAASAYTYDEDNRMVTSEGQAQGFDANGNMTSISSTNLLSYDFENRLAQTVIAGTTSTFQYDGAGNRLATNRDGVVARYVLDRNSSLTQVLEETDASGAATAYYVYGLGLISKIDASGNASYYHYDPRGSTIALTNAGGQITETYAYDPFGRPINLNVSDNRFRYLGRHGVMDELNGFLYVRARYYSTRRGRFITKDPTTGSEGDSQSLNRYIYALNNPVRLIDISGLTPQATTSDTAHSGLLGDSIGIIAGILIEAGRDKLWETALWRYTQIEASALTKKYGISVLKLVAISDKAIPVVGLTLSGGVDLIETKIERPDINGLELSSEVTGHIGFSAALQAVGTGIGGPLGFAITSALQYLFTPTPVY